VYKTAGLCPQNPAVISGECLAESQAILKRLSVCPPHLSTTVVMCRVMTTPQTVLLRHQESRFDREVIGRWLAATTDLVGEIVIEPDWTRQLNTLKHELRRSGITGLIDAIAYRLYYDAALNNKEKPKTDALISDIQAEYPDFSVPEYHVADPNNEETVDILRNLTPDLMLARCKVLLSKSVYAIPKHGTFVIHPGICPEYRNQHGCFWALANGDDDKVGFSLIRINDGIDTGEIFAQHGTTFNPVNDEHVYIQLKVVADNLPSLTPVITAVADGEAEPIPTDDRQGPLWGMPKLSAWLTWKRRVQRFGINVHDSTHDS